MRRFFVSPVFSRSPVIATVLTCFAASSSTQAATLKVSPSSPQPGDVLSLTVFPESGEKVRAIGMAAFDTADVKFYARSDGAARAFLGLPFDRTGGTYTLRARIQVEKAGKVQEQIVSSTFVARTRNFPTQRITMSGKTASTMTKKDALRREKLRVQSKMKNSHPAPLWSGSWIVPSKGSPSSAYGRKRYVNGKWWGQHNGADIKAGAGTPVVAANTGKIVLSEYLSDLRGNCIVIDHGCNVYSIYMHLSQRNVREGEEVRKGEQIGKVGSTGFSTGPHLHWEIRVGWEPVDPFKVVRSGLTF